MSCPKYEDNTRTCVVEFKEILHFVSFDFCDSDEYNDCPIYKLLEGKAKPCKFLQDCRIYFSKMSSETGDFKTAFPGELVSHPRRTNQCSDAFWGRRDSGPYATNGGWKTDHGGLDHP